MFILKFFTWLDFIVLFGSALAFCLVCLFDEIGCFKLNKHYQIPPEILERREKKYMEYMEKCAMCFVLGLLGFLVIAGITVLVSKGLPEFYL